MAAHGYDRKHRKEFWSKFIPKEAFKNNKQKYMDKILTIIIPTYNMSEYLDTCLKSLIIESNLLEVLIINDGSKDNSLDIAKSMRKISTYI